MVLISLYVKCRVACHFPQIFWLGLDCIGHSYLELAVFSLPFHSVVLMDFPFPVLIPDIQVAFGDNIRLLIYARSFPSRTSLRKSSIIKESFRLWVFRFAVFPQGLGCITTGFSMCLKINCRLCSY